MSTLPPIREGMHVITEDGKDLGTVKEVRERDFLIDRPRHRDVYAPLDRVSNVVADSVKLHARSDEVDKADWPKPPLTPGERDTRDRPGGPEL